MLSSVVAAAVAWEARRAAPPSGLPPAARAPGPQGPRLLPRSTCSPVSLPLPARLPRHAVTTGIWEQSRAPCAVGTRRPRGWVAGLVSPSWDLSVVGGQMLQARTGSRAYPPHPERRCQTWVRRGACSGLALTPAEPRAASVAPHALALWSPTLLSVGDAVPRAAGRASVLSPSPAPPLGLPARPAALH